jgi:RimJ/RimL family protein N-acetyltransferase
MIRIMVPVYFETPRMIAHRPTQADFATLREIHTDHATMKTLSEDGSILTEKMSRAIFERHTLHWDATHFGIWLFSLTATGEAIGYCGLRKYSLQGAEELELFFGLHSRFFRKGFGTEMARAVVDVGFHGLNLASVIAFTLADNAGSRALMVKLGMKYEGVLEHAGLPHVLYRLRRGGA